MSKITKDDVINIAKSIKQILTPKEIVEVLNRYEESEDETSIWNLIIEDCIYQTITDKAPYPHNEMGSEEYY